MSVSADDTCVCVLFYGAEDKHYNLARRVLNTSLRKLADMGAFFCFGCNAIGWQTRTFLEQQRSSFFSRSIIIDSPENVYKYPMMRRMLRETGIATNFLLWFDHDSYLQADLDVARWLTRVKSQLTFCDIVGSINRAAINSEHDFSAAQSWPRAPRQTRYVSFPNASWWAAKTAALQANNWPPPELGQKDGDVLFGEFARCFGLSLCHFRDGVKINVNDAGVEGLISRTIT